MISAVSFARDYLSMVYHAVKPVIPKMDFFIGMDVFAGGVPFGTDMGYRSFVAICKRLSSEFPAVCRGFMIEPQPES